MDKSAASPPLEEVAGAESSPDADLVDGAANGTSESHTAVEERKRKRETPEKEEQLRAAVDGESAAVVPTENGAEDDRTNVENGGDVEEREDRVVEEEIVEDAKRQRLNEAIETSEPDNGKSEIESEVGNSHMPPPGEEKVSETATQESIQEISASATSPGGVPADVPQQIPDGQPTSRRIEVPNNKVGVLIGRGGETIKLLQSTSGAKIQIMRDAEADPQAPSRPVELMGTLANINKAEKLIKDVMAEADAGGSPALVARGFGSPLFGEELLQIQIPNEKVGLIIGKGGETIKDLQSRSKARIQLIPQHPPEGNVLKERTVRITGNKEQIESAMDLIKQVMNQVPLRPPASAGYVKPTQPRHRGPTVAQWAPRASPPTQPMSAYNYPPRGSYQTPTTTHFAAYSRPSITPAPTWDQRSSAPIQYRQASPVSAPVSGGYYSQPSPAQPQFYGQPPVMSHYPQQSYLKPTYATAQPHPAMAVQPQAQLQPQPQPQPQQQPYPYGVTTYQQQPYSSTTVPPATVVTAAGSYGQYPAVHAVYGATGGAYSQYPSTGYGGQAVQDSSGYGYTGVAVASGAAEVQVQYGNNVYGMQPPPVGSNPTGYEQNASVPAVAPVSGSTPAGYVQQYVQP